MVNLMKRCSVIICLLVTAASIMTSAGAPQPASGARAMTIEDILGVIRVTDPQLAPDGRSVAFVRTTTDLKTGSRNADIWTVTTKGGDARQLIGEAGFRIAPEA